MNYTLFILLLLCHFAGDFTHLSRPYMLAAKRDGLKMVPIFHHACVHGVLMALVLLFFVPFGGVITLVMIQVATHALIDICKGRLQHAYSFFQSPNSYWHWYLFGADQLLHILVVLLMVYICSL